MRNNAVTWLVAVMIAVCGFNWLSGGVAFAQQDKQPVKQQRMRGARPTPKKAIAEARKFHARAGAPQQFITVPKQLSFWGNSRYGDCVSAEEMFAKACNDPEIFISEENCIAWADKHGVLNGADLLQVIQYMQHDGITQDGTTYYDGVPLNVDYTNYSQLCNAISQGPVKIGVAANQLENVVGNSNGWFAFNFVRDNAEDHCVALCGYGPLAWLAQQLGVTLPANVDGSKPGLALFTWNTIGIIDFASMVAITGEAWLRNPTTVVNGPTPPPAPTPTPAPPFNLPPWLQMAIQIALIILGYFAGRTHAQFLKE